MQKALFLVWKNYQRRAEVLAPQMISEVLFIPHIFRRKAFRLVDYLFKFLVSLHVSIRQKPKFIIAQSPPLYSAVPALLLKIPYVIDAHNPVFQNVGGKISWGKLPLSSFLIRNARAVIVHNHSILNLAKQAYPNVRFFKVSDPIEKIESRQKSAIAQSNIS
ncbi:MAG: hypothetical protein HC895_00605 [Leptolyngbyaceae cyanobacterium SM1_3_5]|nr:hypothetical protein [Leptolyngbyaceae cyanobacterium SM1_3_5]